MAELVSNEAKWCNHFLFGLEYGFHSPMVDFKDILFPTFRDRVVKIAEPCNGSKGSSDQAK